MPVTITSLLNTPEHIIFRAKRTASYSPSDNHYGSNKRRIVSLTPCTRIKSEEASPESEPFHGSEFFKPHYPGWSYWLPPPGESVPPHERLSAPAYEEISAYYAPSGIGLGLGISIPVEMDKVVEYSAQHVDFYFISSPSTLSLDSEETGPRYDPQSPCAPSNTYSPIGLPQISSMPPSPFELLTRRLIQSFMAWRAPELDASS